MAFPASAIKRSKEREGSEWLVEEGPGGSTGAIGLPQSEQDAAKMAAVQNEIHDRLARFALPFCTAGILPAFFRRARANGVKGNALEGVVPPAHNPI